MAQMAVPELSLWGLLARIQEIERLKSDVAHPDEEQQALIATEGAVKKAAAEQLATAATSGLSHKEKNTARIFLQAQLKAVSADAPNAAARKAKLNELLKGVEEAPAADDPVHVRKAREALRRIEKEYKEIHETYEKWEKGKARFKSVDELTSMKRSHDDLQKVLDQAQRHLEAELQSRTGTGAAPPSVSAASKPKPKVAQSSAASCPSSRSPPAKAPTRSQQARPPPPPSNEAARRAQMASQFWEPVVEEEADRPVVPKPKRAPKPAEPAEPEPFLSYQCTCKAIAQVMGCSEKQAKEVGASVSELREQFEVEAWQQVSALSVEIEKKQKEQEKEREKRRMEAALARKADEHGPTVVAAPVPAAARQVAAKVPPKQPPKAKAKPKTAPPKSSSIAGLAHNNRFGSLDDDDDEGGWWTVQK